ncbi:MAG: T9SS type A sorting domain-containing protein [bacterium]
MQYSRTTLTLLPLIACLLIQQRVWAQGPFKVPAYVAGSGGTASANSNHRLVGTLGQATIGTSQNATQRIDAGFWNLPDHIRFTRPPDTWNFVSNTGGNATIAVPAAINPAIGSEPLQTGDAIGVFFMRDNHLVCAGFSVWQSGRNVSITAWADDPQTALKEGFAEGELINYKIWDESALREYNATVTYQTGGPNFATNGIYALSSLMGVTTVTQSVVLASGWNMISSFVEPSNPDLQAMFSSILANLVIVKNGAGQVFWPQFGINTIGQWNPRHGYQINLSAASALAITGMPVVPEATAIQLNQGWNLVAYLRNSSQNIETALASIANRIVIVKNNAGQVFWPQFNINTIGSMQPGEGYQMNVSQAATLTYPANGAMSAGLEKSGANWTVLEVHEGATRHYPLPAKTGANAIFLIRFPQGANGDEIAVVAAAATVVGSGVLHQGTALITVWGDDALTEEITEGAVEGDALALKLWSPADQTEKALEISSLTDALAGAALDPAIHYQAEAAWVADVAFAQERPTSFSLSQNYPNPFNPATRIQYALPENAQVKLTVYDMLGQRVAVLVDKKQPAGYHEIIFQATPLPSGMYFYRLHAGSFVETRKMVVLK